MWELLLMLLAERRRHWTVCNTRKALNGCTLQVALVRYLSQVP